MNGGEDAVFLWLVVGDDSPGCDGGDDDGGGGGDDGGGGNSGNVDPQ